MADPVASFLYRYQMFVVRTPDLYGYATTTSDSSYSVQDSSNSGQDDLTKFGDVSPDIITATNSSGSTQEYSYIGTRTTGGADPAGGDGIFAQLNGTPYLFTNTLAQPGAMYAYASQGTVYDATCFTTGTLISTARGDVAVEELQVGDLAVTASGDVREIIWIGHRKLDGQGRALPRNQQPIRISAGSIGDSKPIRDLIVSPGHAIALDMLGEVLIPASSLVNGATITRECVESITYWHIELESHDILIAEGQPSESYLEAGNRSFFSNNDKRIVTIAAGPDNLTNLSLTYCRPFYHDGPLVAAARLQTQARAEAKGWRLVETETSNAWTGVFLEVDGDRVEPDIRGLLARFHLPSTAREVALVCPTSMPCNVRSGDDGRELGLCLSRLIMDDGFNTSAIDLDDVRLIEGLHAHEGSHRWTSGYVPLERSLWAELRGELTLRLSLDCAPLPRWIAPTGKSVVNVTEDNAASIQVVAAA